MKDPINNSGPKCPECGTGVLVPFTRREEFDYDLGDKTIRVTADGVPVERCSNCEKVAVGSAAAKVRHDAVCKAAGYPTPSEQKAIRERLDWSQQYLADLTGYGVATVSRSERGRLLANRSYYKTLLAVRDCPAYRDYLEQQYRVERGQQQGSPPASSGVKQEQVDVAVEVREVQTEVRSRFRTLVPSTAQLEQNKLGRPPRTRGAA